MLYIPKLDYILFKKYYIRKFIYNLPKAGLIIKAISFPINYIIIIATIIVIFMIRYKKGNNNDQ